MPHGCMPGGIVAAMLDKFSTIYQKPWISLTYDGFAETNNLTRINNFAEVIRFCNEESQAGQLDSPVLISAAAPDVVQPTWLFVRLLFEHPSEQSTHVYHRQILHERASLASVP